MTVLVSNSKIKAIPFGQYPPIYRQNYLNDSKKQEATKTKGYRKLRPSEAEKINCGKKHFEALDVPFDVVVSAKDG